MLSIFSNQKVSKCIREVGSNTDTLSIKVLTFSLRNRLIQELKYIDFF